MKKLEFFRLEDRVLFEAAAAVEIVDAMENNDPNANMNEADRQAQEERDAIKNAPPENPAEQITQSDWSDLSDLPGFDAGLDPEIDALINDIFTPALPEGDLLHLSMNNNGETVSTGKELVIINSSVMDAGTIIDTLAPNQEVLHLEAGSDAMQQILDYLDSSDTKYDSIHIFSHGNAGYFVLNGEVFDGENFDAAEWAAVGEHVSENGDILLYGCNLAENEAGRDFIAQIADASGADVAASTNATGISGDWTLEYSHGLVETTSISVENYVHNLTSYLVTNLNDSGTGSLRQAVLDANANTGADEITFSVNGTITLTSGEIAITDSVTITGNGAANTIISGNNASRIFSISGTTTIATLDGLTITDGNANSGSGGGIHVTSGTIVINNSVISGNKATFSGGAIFGSSNSTININYSTITGNRASGGGGIRSQSDCTININYSTISDNIASSSGGGIYGYGNSTINVSNSTVSDNSAGNAGGGICGGVASTIHVSNSTVSNNSAGSAGGGIYGHTNTTINVNNSSTITGNSATTDGGGVYGYGNSAIHVSNSTITGNSATTNGGGIYGSDSSTINVSNSTISNNSATVYDGGGICSYGDSAINVNNSTIYGNSTGNVGGGIGGGINTTINVNNSTISGNSAVVDGGGIYGFGLSTINVLNSIVLGNYSGSTPNTADDISFADPNYTLNISYSVYGVLGGSYAIGGDAGNITNATLKTLLNAKWSNEAGGKYQLLLDDGSSNMALNSDGIIEIVGTNALTRGVLTGRDSTDYYYSTNRGTSWTNFTSVGNGAAPTEIFISDQLGFGRNLSSVSMGAVQAADSRVIAWSGDENVNYLSATNYYTSANIHTDISNAYNRYLYFVGATITLIREISITGNINIIGGTLGQTILSGNNANRIFNIFGAATVATLDGLTITDGNIATGNIRADLGGGIYVNSGTANISNCTISGNSASRYGGGIFGGSDSTINVNSSIISDNRASSNGGGIYINGGAITIAGSTISDNTGSSGGGIYINTGTVTIGNSTIAGNEADTWGGGIFTNGTVNVVDSTISGNMAGTSGGGIYVYQGGMATIASSTISGNSTGSGGGIYIGGGTASLLNSIVIGNTALNATDIDGTVNAVYTVSSTLLAGTGNTQSTAEAVFVNTAPADHVYAIKTDGVAAYKGTMVYSGTNNRYYYHDGTNYRQANGTVGTETSYRTTAVAQNGVSRWLGNGVYNVGAYALDSAIKGDELVVTTSTDWFNPFSNLVSLREALNYAQRQGGTRPITFDATIDGEIITLALGELRIDFPVTVQGNGAANTIISGNNSSRVFSISGTTTVATLDGLTITDGNAAHGGGIYMNGGTLNLSNSAISANSTYFDGGGIFVNDGTTNISNCTISENSADYDGGGIFVNGGTVNISNSTISGNSAEFGGGIFANDGTTNLLNNIIVGNAVNDINRITGSTTLNAKYNIYGSSGITMDASNTQSTAEAVFVNTTPADHVYAIKAEGVAAYKGTQVYSDSDGKYYYFDGTDYRQADGTVGTAATYTAITTSQNGIDRTLGDTVFNAGAYALVASTKGLNVTTTTDWINPFSNLVSLREALNYAHERGGAPVITFDTAINGEIITLVLGELFIDFSVTVQGNGAANTIISGNDSSRVFYISGAVVTLDALTVQNGNANTGGGIYVAAGTVSLSNSIITGNAVTFRGGGIYVNNGTVNIVNSTFSGNSSDYTGGGIYMANGTLNASNSTIAYNDAIYGGGIFCDGGTANLLNNIIIGNNAIYPVESDIMIDIAGILNGKYNIVGTGTVFNDGGGSWGDTNTESVDTDIFTGLSNGLYSIKASGLAAFNGVLTGRIGNMLYYRDMSTDNWCDITGTSSGMQFINDVTRNYGLLGGQVCTDSQNGASRVATHLAYNVGAYGLDTVTKGLVVDTTADYINPFAAGISLREAMAHAEVNGGGTITFDTTVFGSAARTITLTLGEIAYSATGALVIDAGNAAALTVTVPVAGASTHRVFKFGGNTNVTLTNMTLLGGDISGYGNDSSTSYGGVIHAGNSSTLTLNHINAQGAKAFSGGGIHIWDGTLNINHSTISGNTATHNGGGILFNGALTLENSTVSSNTTVHNGGGIYAEGSVTVKSSTVSGNKASFGGGIFGYSNAAINVSRSTISGNAVNNGGGGIYAEGSVTVVNSTISGNRAIANGGGIYINSRANILNSILAGNYTGDKEADDIFTHDRSLNMQYSVYGYANYSIDATNVQADIQDVYGANVGWSSTTDQLGLYYLVYNDDNNSPVFDGATYAISAEGAAAYSGTLTAQIGDAWYYRNRSDNFWYGTDGNRSSYQFIDNGSDYGLTGGEIQSAGLNGNSRTVTHLAYNAGSHALAIAVKTANLVVNTTADRINPFSSQTSLREAVAHAEFNNGGTITFDAAVFGSAPVTLTLTNEIAYNNTAALRIDGSNAAALTITVPDAGHRVFNFSGTDINVTLSNMSILGGGVRAGGNASVILTLNGVAVQNGDGIHADANDVTVNVINSTISGNTTSGIDIRGYDSATLNLINSIVLDNASDLHFNAKATVNAAYSIYGSIEGDVVFGVNIGNITGELVGTVFDSTGAISAEGAAAWAGTLTGKAGDTWYFRHGSSEYLDGWYFMEDGRINFHSEFAGDPANNYGLTGGTVNTTALNNESRVETHLAYNIGAYALQVLPGKDYSMVTTVDDRGLNPFAGGVSLREAVEAANRNIYAANWSSGGNDYLDGYRITFSDMLFALGTPVFVLAYGQLTVDANEHSSPLLIDGGDDREVTVKVPVTFAEAQENGSAASNYRILYVGYKKNVQLRNLDLRGGDVSIHSGNLGSGGVILADSDAGLSLDGVTVSGGRAESGGGIFAAGDVELELENSQIRNNSAVYGGGIGGAIGSELTITGSKISGNKAQYGGGIYLARSATLNITESTITANVASASGGGIYVMIDSEIIVLNSTIAANSAVDKGGGIYGVGDITVVNATVAGNTSAKGGGIYGSNVTLINSLVLGNRSANDLYVSEIFRAAYSIYGSHNDAEGDRSMGNIEDAAVEKIFGSLILVDGALPVVADSPAAGLGTLVGFDDGEGDFYFMHEDSWQSFTGNDQPGELYEFDQRGDIRNVNDFYAIGALASSYVPPEPEPKPTEVPSLTVTTLDDIVNNYDGMISLREALMYAQSNPELGYTVTFADALFAGGNEITITIDSDLIIAREQFVIDGGNGRTVTIKAQENGDFNNRIFSMTFQPNVDLTFRNLHLHGGNINGNGGAIHVDSAIVNLTLEHVTISGSRAISGGGIYASGGILNIHIINSTIAGNRANTVGGGIEASGNDVTVNIINSTIAANSADSGGGICVQGDSATLNLINSIVLGNYGSDLYFGNDATFNAAYSIYGYFNDAGGGRSMANIENAAIGQVFDSLTLVNGVLPVLVDSPAAGGGTLGGRHGSDFYFMHEGAWTSFTGSGEPGEIYHFDQKGDIRNVNDFHAIGALSSSYEPPPYVPPVVADNVSNLYSSGLFLDYTSTLVNIQVVESMRNSEAKFTGSAGSINFASSAVRSLIEYAGTVAMGTSRNYDYDLGSVHPADKVSIGIWLISDMFKWNAEQPSIGGDNIELQFDYDDSEWEFDTRPQQRSESIEAKVSSNTMFAYLDEPLPSLLRREPKPAVIPEDIPELAVTGFDAIGKADAFKSSFDRALEELLTI